MSVNSVSEVSDSEVVERVRAGETDAFRFLIERYENKLLRYARKFLLNSDDSRDLVQDVFMKAYANLRSFDTKRKFSSWLYRIAHNEFINALKKRSIFPTIPLPDTDIILPSLLSRTVEEAAIDREARRDIDRGLDELDPKYREPLILYYFEELSYQEIADILQIPPATVGVRLKRGRDMLKKTLT